MEEIEVKILNIDKVAIVEKLLQLGAKKVFEGPMNSVYLDNENNTLTDGKKMLRLRQKGEKNIVTLKIRKPNEFAKICNEYEINVCDFDKARAIFKLLGFTEYATDLRKRLSFKLKNSLVEIDLYDDIPPFLEVESPDIQQLKEIVELLDFSMSDTRKWSGKDVMKFYTTKNSVDV